MPDAEGWTPTPGEGLVAIVWYVPILVWVAALLFAAIAIARAPRPLSIAVIIDKLLRYLFFFPLGVQGLWAFAGHVFFAGGVRCRDRLGAEPVPRVKWVSPISGSLSRPSMRPSRAMGRGRQRPPPPPVSRGRGDRPHPGHRGGGEFRAGQCRADPDHRLPHADRDSWCCCSSSRADAPRRRRAYAARVDARARKDLQKSLQGNGKR